MLRAGALALLANMPLSFQHCGYGLLHLRRFLEIFGQAAHTLDVLLLFLIGFAFLPLLMSGNVPVFIDNLLRSLSLVLAEFR